ncbi:MAG TPA: hypothetical protein VH165_06820 [Kofleriaceae bacterium]|nr:hypothetical protein [Kofleriaceae bacterium]
MAWSSRTANFGAGGATAVGGVAAAGGATGTTMAEPPLPPPELGVGLLEQAARTRTARHASRMSSELIADAPYLFVGEGERLMLQ